ncbi:hypothetical protein FQA39_LY03397 [Lamprigera yunnana]|nr:hypothetical protein FQA39_LY03397 [Lamprigera yunnana]
MDWDDGWQIILIVFAVLVIIAVILHLCKKKKRAKRNTPQVERVSTIQEAYVPSPSYNPTYQNYVGWNSSFDNNNQNVAVNIRPAPEGFIVIPRQPASIYGPPYPYEKPPPYNPNM